MDPRVLRWSGFCFVSWDLVPGGVWTVRHQLPWVEAVLSPGMRGLTLAAAKWLLPSAGYQEASAELSPAEVC